MANGICHSVAYHLGQQRCDGMIEDPSKPEDREKSSAPGGFLLIWPLFFAGMLSSEDVVCRAEGMGCQDDGSDRCSDGLAVGHIDGSAAKGKDAFVFA